MTSGNRGGTGAAAAAAAPLQLALFDDRRSGSDDEDPSDQLLAFYPQHIPAEDRAGAVGLMRAVMAFTSIFTEVALVANFSVLWLQQHVLLMLLRSCLHMD